MTQELKVYLNLFAKYLTQTIGCSRATFTGEYYDFSLHNEMFHTCKGMDRSPIPMMGVIDEWLEENKDTMQYNGEGEDPYGIRVEIDGNDRTISVYEEYTEYRVDDEETTTIDVEGEPELKEILKYYCEIEEICRGLINWDFSGGGDSGYIEESGQADFKDGNIQISNELEDMCYRMLNDYGGWEINEGSMGRFVLDLDMEELTLNFSWNLEEGKETLLYQEKF